LGLCVRVRVRVNHNKLRATDGLFDNLDLGGLGFMIQGYGLGYGLGLWFRVMV
jgi:hypothetical protein